jgi:hypothetical protein
LEHERWNGEIKLEVGGHGLVSSLIEVLETEFVSSHSDMLFIIDDIVDWSWHTWVSILPVEVLERERWNCEIKF